MTSGAVARLARLCAWAAVLTVTWSSVPRADVAMRVDRRDRAWVHPDLERLRPREIALLPAVVFAHDPEAARTLERNWLGLFLESGHGWHPAPRARRLMAAAARRPDSLHDAVARQVRRQGHVDGATASALGRLLGAESVLSLRIDRWEVVSGRAMVEVTAALVDSSGRLLWKMTGQAGHGRTRPSGGGIQGFAAAAASGPAEPGWMSQAPALSGAPTHGGPPAPAAWGPPREVAFRPNAPLSYLPGSAERALYTLLARWAPALPPAPDAADHLAASAAEAPGGGQAGGTIFR